MKNFQILSSPRDIYKKMLNDLIRAKKSVYLETYVYDNDSVGNMFKKALIKKAKEGIKINVLVDSWGSTADKKYFKDLVDSGAEVRFFREFKYVFRFFTKNHERNHRKLLIIDEKVTYIGSINITQTCLDWGELALRLEGEISHDFTKSFFQSWESFGELNKKKLDKLIHKGFEIIQEIPSIKYKPTEKKYFNALNRSKKEILIMTPYFVPSGRIRRALKNAVKRGVKVKIILPFFSGVHLSDIARNYYLGELHKNGIELYYYKPSVLHSKLLLVDDNFFILGSSNVDYRSFLYLFEINLIGKDKQIIKGLKEYFNKILNDCEPFHYSKWKARSFIKKVLERLLFRVRRYL